MLRWLEGYTRGPHHSSQCLFSSSLGVDLTTVVSGPPSPAPRVSRVSHRSPAEALRQEGLKYLKDLHVIEHQHQHSQRLLTMKHLILHGTEKGQLAEAVRQACAGLAPPPEEADLNNSTKASSPLRDGRMGPLQGETPLQEALLQGAPEETDAAREEMQRVAEAETALKEALRTPEKRQLSEGLERETMVRGLFLSWQ